MLLLPYFSGIGSPAFRRAVVERIPSVAVQQGRKIVDLMDNTSRDILKAKREVIQRGGEAVTQQVGSGKDIMSVLCEFQLHRIAHIY